MIGRPSEARIPAATIHLSHVTRVRFSPAKMINSVSSHKRFTRPVVSPVEMINSVSSHKGFTRPVVSPVETVRVSLVVDLEPEPSSWTSEQVPERPSADMSPGRGFESPLDVPDFSRAGALIREKGIDGTAEFLADKTESAVADQILGLWRADGQEVLAQVSGDLLDLKIRVHEEIGALAAGLFPAKDGAAIFAGAIAQYTPLDLIDRELGDTALGVEVFGLVLGLLSANPAMTAACAKALFHDLVHRALVVGFKKLLSGEHPQTPDRDAEPRQGHLPDDERGSGHQPAADAGGALLGIGIAGHTGPAEATPAGTSPGIEPAATPVPAREAAQEVPDRQTSARGWTVPGEGRNRRTLDAASATVAEGAGEVEEDTVRRDDLPEDDRSSVRAGTLRDGGKAPGTPAGWQASFARATRPATTPRSYLTFVRLRLHYNLQTGTRSASDDGQPVRLARLIVVRDSRRFPVAGPGTISSGTPADNEAGYVAGQLARQGTCRAWQIQDADNAGGVTLTKAATTALINGLSRTVTGLAPKTQLAGMTITPVPATPYQPTRPGARVIEIIGITSDASGTPKLQALAVGTPARDRFAALVTAALSQQ